MKHPVYILSLCIAIAALTPAAFAHRYHTSVTRLEYNTEEKSVEITVQTFADDLEAVLSKRAGSKVRLDGSKHANALLFDYLRSVFQLKSGNSAGELQWIGMELKGHSAWIYLQSKAPLNLSKASLSNALLFELFEDQVNIVNVHNRGRTASLVFKRGDNSQEIP
ncbi:MAG: DUF6702 family protein [Pyrinomonadaceae bacterium]